jgi:hypothetical protein
MNKNFQNFITIFAICLIIGVFCVFSNVEKVESGAGENVSGWAWSDNIGWICFNSTTDGSAHNYGVNINDTTGEFSGYAWSDNVGWISFEPGDVAVCPVAGTCETKLDKDTGEVSGWAKVLSSGSWIRLSDNTGDDVKVSTATGHFHNYAWSDDYGWISFNSEGSGPDYKVATGFSFNEAPTINSVSHSPLVKESGTGELVNFSSDASDPNSGTGDKIKLYVCKDSGCSNCEPGNTSGCLQSVNGAVVSATSAATNPTAQYETGDCESVEKNYYAKVCDLSNECSAGTVSSSSPLVISKHNGCACGCSDGACDECYGDGPGGVYGDTGFCCFGICQREPCSNLSVSNAVIVHADTRYCGAGQDGNITARWTYNNTFSENAKTYKIQVSTNNSFTLISDPNLKEKDISVNAPPGNVYDQIFVISPSPSPLAGDLEIYYNENYFWRVKAYDAYGNESNWKNGENIKTPKHPYPDPDFTIDPVSPSIGVPVQLCSVDDTGSGGVCPVNESVCHGAGAPSCSGKEFEWDISVNGSFVGPDDKDSENPIIQFSALGAITLRLEIDDNSINDGMGDCGIGCCAISKDVNATGLPLPEWWEISPSF